MTEAEIRAAHPDWTDEQVAAEVARLQAAPPADQPVEPPKSETDPVATQAEVDKAYAKLRDSEKARAEAERKLKEREDAELSETERLKKENDENRQIAAAATANARNANLLAALAGQGLTGGKGQAAARLLDSIEYDSNDQPTNLDEAITAAKGTYGEDVFAPATPPPAPKPPAPGVNPGSGGQPGPEPVLTAEEVAAAERAGMTPKAYEAMKGVSTFKDWQDAQARLQPQQ